jgi:hypothetical protein
MNDRHDPHLADVLLGVLVGATLMTLLVISIRFLLNNHDAHIDDAVERCLDAGGIPDRYGRRGQHLTCHMPGEP